MTILPSRQFPGAVHALRRLTAHPHHRRRFRFIVLITGVVLFVLVCSLLAPSSNHPPPKSPFFRGPLNIKFKPSSFNWKSALQHHPSPLIHHLPGGKPREFGRVQFDFQGYVHDETTKRRQDAVKSAFVRSWNSYKKHAWMQDELAPVTGGGKSTFGGWAATLVDSLDTLWIMGLEDDFKIAATASAQLDWARTTEKSINVFETTIRHLGGLLSAYDLSGEGALLEKARELGDMLFVAFDTPNRLPGFWLNFQNANQGLQEAGTSDPSASPCSLSLEFTRLSQLTGDDKYYDAVSRVTDFLEKSQNDSKIPGMWPKLINFRSEKISDNSFTLGALSDSLYEYLPKMAILMGGQEARYEKMHRAAMEVVEKHLIFRPMLPEEERDNDILFMGDATAWSDNIKTIPDSQHLSCFSGGMFGLGGKVFDIPDHVGVGERLARGCAWAYGSFPTGLMPEIFSMVSCESWKDGPCQWDDKVWEEKGDDKFKKGFSNVRDRRYILRPEAIESVFLLYRMTGKEDLRETAWRMFEAIMKATRTPLGNSAIRDVTVTEETKKLDSMESFWLSETLKYFYLIFSPPDVISLDEYVFNTEAHPFRRPAGLEREPKM